MENKEIQDVLDAVLEGTDTCLQSPECTDLGDDKDGEGAQG